MLRYLQNTNHYKMTYSITLEKRITRHRLIEKAGLDRGAYWDFFEISDSEFDNVLKLGNVNENFFVQSKEQSGISEKFYYDYFEGREKVGA